MYKIDRCARHLPDVFNEDGTAPLVLELALSSTEKLDRNSTARQLLDAPEAHAVSLDRLDRNLTGDSIGSDRQVKASTAPRQPEIVTRQRLDSASTEPRQLDSSTARAQSSRTSSIQRAVSTGGKTRQTHKPAQLGALPLRPTPTDMGLLKPHREQRRTLAHTGTTRSRSTLQGLSNRSGTRVWRTTRPSSPDGTRTCRPCKRRGSCTPPGKSAWVAVTRGIVT